MSSTHFTLLDGTRVAYQEWGADQPKKVIALHGWLDNSNSFQAVAPYLASNGYHIVAIDFIGHGHTSHLPYAGTYNMPRMVQSIREVVHRCLSWDKSYVIGHSMGAGIGLLYSGSYPESVNKLVMIDLLGPLADNSFRTAKDLRAATDLSMKFTEKLTSGSAQKQYQSLKDVIAARLESVKKFPGNQTLSFEAAKAIMSR